jgi:hypothetical protein
LTILNHNWFLIVLTLDDILIVVLP